MNIHIITKQNCFIYVPGSPIAAIGNLTIIIVLSIRECFHKYSIKFVNFRDVACDIWYDIGYEITVRNFIFPYQYGTVFGYGTKLRYGIFKAYGITVFIPYRTVPYCHPCPPYTNARRIELLAGWRQVTVIWVTDLGNVGVVQPYLFESIPQVESTSIGTSEY